MESDLLLDPFKYYTLPLKQWVQFAVDWTADNFRPFFQAIRMPMAYFLDLVTTFLLSVPPTIFLIVLFLFAWQLAGFGTAVFVTFAMFAIGLLGIWHDTLITLAIILTAVSVCVVIGVPIGILAGRNDRFEALLRPLLDVLQTLPAFVYLVPIVMLVGIGNVPGVFVTVFFALPPIIRLTSLGIRSVPLTAVEAAYAFGSTHRQVLTKVQMPLAIRNIMAGLNQTLMMALAMVVYASMIAVEGLGQTVLRGIGRLDMGLAAIGGIGIVLLAMILDRITQALGAQARHSINIATRGPIGLVRLLARPMFVLAHKH
ncbi:MAG: ABC transporter permease [Dongiaceae bacterium]